MRNKILNMYYNRIENFGGFTFRFGIFKTENQEILKRGVGERVSGICQWFQNATRIQSIN